MKNLKNDFKLYIFLCIVFVLYIFLKELFFDGMCPFLYIFGFPCAGCKMTRAFLLLLNFKFSESLNMHPFAMVFSVYFLYFVFSRYFRKKDFSFFIPSLMVLSIFYCGFYVLRLFMPEN